MAYTILGHTCKYMNFDILIIGGGPGGYVAAIRAAQLGANVCVVENRELGGTCLNRGCIPTKALYKTADVLQITRKLKTYGLTGSSATADINNIQNRKNNIVSQLRGGVEMLLAENGVTVLNGTASFIDEKNIHVDLNIGGTENVTAKNIIIATGSSPFTPNIPGNDLKGVITTDDLLEIDYIPKRLAVIGAGTVGVEFAGIFNALGSEVSIIIRYPRVLRKLDVETISKFSTPFFKQGINLVGDVTIKAIEKTENGLVVISENKNTGEEVRTEADTVLMSAGRRPNINKLNLENAKIQYCENGIEVNDNYQTNISNIYAIGDVLGKIMLAYVASDQGIKVVEYILEGKEIKPLGPIPDCVFSFPEIATTGKTEEQVKEEGIDYSVGRFAFASNGKALTMSETEGFIKIISDNKTDKILGVNIVGPHASDLIHEAIVAMTNNLTIEDIIHSIHAHPTLAETFLEAAMDVHNISLHSAPKWNKIKSSDENTSANNNDATHIKMPKLNALMQEGTIQEWVKKEGDTVNVGDTLCIIEGTKITQEFKSTVSGKLTKILLKDGETTKIDENICIINSIDENTSENNDEATHIKMPKLNALMQSGTIQEWAKKEGDTVNIGDTLCVIEGTKITQEFKSTISGKLTKIILKDGETTEVDNDICIIK